jgi:hypothetical protein
LQSRNKTQNILRATEEDYKCELNNYNYHDSSDVGFDFSHSGAFLVINDHLRTVLEKEKRAFSYRKDRWGKEVGYLLEVVGGWWMGCWR